MLRVIEIFGSIQGESSYQGLPFAFIRLARCNLRCVWCDTEYSFRGGQEMSQAQVLETVASYGVRHACVTGGEPLLQRDESISLMKALLAREYTVTLETHGALSLEGVPAEVARIVDVKTPEALGKPDDDAFRAMHFHYPNLELLTPLDEVKIVVSSRSDYEWARTFIREHDLDARCGSVLLSPAWGLVQPSDLAAWVMEDRLPVRLNLQLHKFVWGEGVAGV
ncbi:MAG: 7-carboxy-7-deazaguanine synthase [Myxococcota bacterium]|jgi:7-carboxy-7-deazaguanine synthase